MNIIEKEINEKMKEFRSKMNESNRAYELVESIEESLKELQELWFEVTYNTTSSVRGQIQESLTYKYETWK